MKWLRYCLVVLSFILFAPAAIAGKDPIKIELSGGIPSMTYINALYNSNATYTLTNQMPVSETVNISTTVVNPADFTVGGTCGTSSTLAPGASCTVTVVFQPLSVGKKSFQLNVLFCGNLIHVPPITSTTVDQPVTGLLTPTYTPGLPATMGAGERRDITITYTNNTNGIVQNVQLAKALNDINFFTMTGTGVNAVVVGVPTSTCPLNGAPANFAPGQSCIVKATIQIGTPGTYTATNQINYTGGATVAGTSTTATPKVVASMAQNFPPNMGAGGTTTLVFRFTNTSQDLVNGAVYGAPAAVPPVLPYTFSNISAIQGPFNANGGSSTITTNTCNVASLAPNSYCDVTLTFAAGTVSPPAYSDQIDFTFGGGVLHNATTANGQPLVTGVPTVPLPNTVGAGLEVPYEFTFTNNSGAVINGASAVVAFQGAFGVPPAPSVNTCALPIAANGGTCKVSGTFTTGPAIPGGYSVTATLTYGGGTVPVTTSAANAGATVTGAPSAPLLPNPMGAGEEQPFAFTFTNPLSSNGTAKNLTSVTFTPTGGTVSASDVTACITPQLVPGQSCTVTGTFQSGTPGAYTLIATLTYAGGTVTTQELTTGTPKVAGTFLSGFPTGGVGTGEQNTIVAKFTNNGTGKVYGILDPRSSVTTVGGFCVGGVPAGITTTCGMPGPVFPATLDPGAFCTVSCVYQTNAPTPAPQITSILPYAGGNAIATASSTAAVKVIGAVLVPLPGSGKNTDSYPVQFSFHNTGPGAVWNTAIPVLTKSPNTGTLTTDATSASCALNPLPSGATCTIDGTLSALTIGQQYRVTAQYTYDGGIVTTSTGPMNATSFRPITLNNYCGQDVWFAFSGAEARKGCSVKNPCAKGSSCDAKANGGKGICYYNNPVPAKGDYRLSAMKDGKPGSTKVMIEDMGAINATIWSGSVAGRTGCDGSKACATADCNSEGGNKACPAGHGFASPVTQAQFTLMRDAEDTYSIQTGKGINLSMSMGPSDPAKTSPAYHYNTPNYCATPGSADDKRIAKACSWNVKTRQGEKVVQVSELADVVKLMKDICPSVAVDEEGKEKTSYTCMTKQTLANKKVMNVTEYTISFCPEMAPTSPYRQ